MERILDNWVDTIKSSGSLFVQVGGGNVRVQCQRNVSVRLDQPLLALTMEKGRDQEVKNVRHF